MLGYFAISYATVDIMSLRQVHINDSYNYFFKIKLIWNVYALNICKGITTDIMLMHRKSFDLLSFTSL